ncbi:hypothetical protein RQP46_008300 [Phenoliferia psychrophenolica]
MSSNGTETLPFFHRIGENGLVGALTALDDELRASGLEGILSKKQPWSWTGKTVSPGEAGLYSKGGLPKVIIKPGRYPSGLLSNWFARKWDRVVPLSESLISSHGLIVVQVSQNQCAVISDPSQKVFIVKNEGFVAFSIAGSFRVLGVVDQINLKTEIIDPLAGLGTSRILGHTQSVHMSSAGRDFVVATFLDVPANNVVVLQKGDFLEELPAGQHVITAPNVTVRGWFTKGESQLEMASRDMYTKDQVPVELRVYLRWQLIEPLKLCHHGYNTPYEALKDKTLSVLTQIVSHLEYSSMIKQRAFRAGDAASDGPDNSSQAFLDALRTQALDELHEAALEYGILFKDLAVIDRKFKGEIAKQMDSLVTRALQAQVESSNVERENSNRVKKEEGSLQVAQVQARQRKTDADAGAYALVAQAKAQAEGVKIAAQAEAEAIRITAKADAEAIALRGDADSLVKDGHARAIQVARIEVQRVSAFGDKTVFVPTESTVGANVAAGFGLATGGNEARK